MKNSIFFYILFISIASNAQKTNFWQPTNYHKFDSLFLSIEKNYSEIFDIEKAKSDVKSLYQIADKTQNSVLLSRSLYFDARNRIFLNSDSIDLLLKKQLSLINKYQNGYDYARAKFLQGDYYSNTGNLTTAYKIWQEQLAYFRSINENTYTGNTLSRMGVVLAKINENQKALSLLEEANYYYKKANQTINIKKNNLNISNTLYQLGDKEKATKNLKLLLKDPEILSDTEFIINVMLSLFSHSSDMNEKEKYARKNYYLAKEFGNKDLIIKAGSNYASLLSKQGRYTESLKILDELYKISFQLNSIDGYRLIYGNKAIIYTERKQWDSAYYYTSLYHTYNDSIIGSQKIIEINKLEAREAINKIEQEKKETELQKKIILAVLFGVFCFSISIISVFYSRKKKMELQKKIKETENERLKTEINFKNRELASNTLLLTEKNRVLEELSQQLKTLEFQGNIPTEEEKQLRKKIEKSARS